jgi:predicted deacylase
VKIMSIRKSVEGRELNIIQIGNENAPRRIFIRARAHAWEPGGNWVVEGIINTLLQQTTESMNYLKNYTVYILPMSNIDGVAHGITRFNMNGMDLNRKLTQPADPILSPENAAMEHWLESIIAKGLKPDLAIDFHNDTYGPLFFAPLGNETGNYEKNMLAFVKLLDTETWFTGGHSFAEASSFEVGMMRRYGIEAMVFELNAQWIKGLNKKPLSEDWLLLGNQLCRVFNEYFNVMK